LRWGLTLTNYLPGLASNGSSPDVSHPSI
jgi:hypothetical protein